MLSNFNLLTIKLKENAKIYKEHICFIACFIAVDINAFQLMSESGAIETKFRNTWMVLYFCLPLSDYINAIQSQN